MTINKTDLLGVVMIVIGMFGMVARNGGTIIDLSPENPTVVDTIDAPSSDLQMRVLPIIKALRGKPKAAAEFYAFYRDFAVVLDNDEQIKTVGQFTQIHDKSLDVFLALNPEAVVSGLGEAVEKASGKQPNVAMDAKKRDEIVEFLEALAWAADGVR